jgi:hypothetical protein
MSGSDLFDHRMQCLAAGDIAGLLDDYASDARVVRFVGMARGKEEIRAYLNGYLAAHGRLELITLDQFFETDDVVIWHATVDTAHGAAQIDDALILDENGLIRLELPGLHGYWGRS